MKDVLAIARRRAELDLVHNGQLLKESAATVAASREEDPAVKAALEQEAASWRAKAAATHAQIVDLVK